MNICFVNSTRKWGGVKTWTLDVAAGLQGRGHAVSIAARPGPFPERARTLGLAAREEPFGCDYNPLAVARFMRLFREEKTDLVMGNVSKDLRTAGIAARLLRIPLVQRVGLPGDMRNKLDVRLMHRWLKPHILVPCRFIKDGLVRELPHLHDTPIEVILTGKRPAQQPPDRAGSPLTLVSTSQLTPDKGHGLILEALAGLKGDYDFHYHVLGTGWYGDELRRQSAAHGLEDRVTFHGFRTDVSEFLATCDVFLLPSRSEGLPNALLEAMARGLVPVARDVGGVSEVWPKNLDLLLPPEAESGQFQQALTRVLSSPGRDILTWKHTAWQACQETFNLDDQVARLDEWLSSLLQ